MKKEDKAGLYTTVIIHLAVLIVLLATSLGFSLQSENSFVLDFSKLEEVERMQAEVERLRQEVEFQQAISEKLERELGAASGGVRNVAVDRGALKDDRGTDAEQLYRDAERLANHPKPPREQDAVQYISSDLEMVQRGGHDETYAFVFHFSISPVVLFFRPRGLGEDGFELTGSDYSIGGVGLQEKYRAGTVLMNNKKITPAKAEVIFFGGEEGI